MTTIHDLSGPAQALLYEAQQSDDPAGYLRAADDWLPEDRRRVAEVLGLSLDVTPTDEIAGKPCDVLVRDITDVRVVVGDVR